MTFKLLYFCYFPFSLYYYPIQEKINCIFVIEHVEDLNLHTILIPYLFLKINKYIQFYQYMNDLYPYRVSGEVCLITVQNGFL